MFRGRIPMRKIRTLLLHVRHRPAEHLPGRASFWFLCFTAIVVFVVSFVLSVSSASFTTRFCFALPTILTTTAIQKLAVLEFVVILLHRKRSNCAIVVEALLSNWTEASLTIVAVWKGQGNIVQAFVIGTVAINELLLLGICFIYGGRHDREPSYPLLSASMHYRVIPFCVALSLGPSVIGTGFGGNDEIDSRNAHITAVLLLVLFVCHLIFLCQIHMSYPLQALGLLRMVYPHDDKDGPNLNCGMSRRITSATAHRIQVQREEWLYERLLLPDASDSVVNNRKPWDSALTTVILLLACGASLVSCFYLVDAISPTDVTSWKSPLHVGYLVAPFFTTAAGLSAMYLHGRWCTSGLDPGQVVCGAMTTTFRLLCFVIPASILIGWITSSGANIMFLNDFQIALLGIAVLLPIYAIQAACDDWLSGTALLTFYIFYASSAWFSS